MRKRIQTIILALALLLTAAAPALAAGAVLSAVVPEGTVAVGDSFAVTVRLDGNPGFRALEFTLAYDSTMLSCNYANIGSLMSGASLAATNPNAKDGVRFSAVSMEDITADGIVAVIGFTAKAAGETDLQLTLTNLSDADLHALPGTAAGAHLTIAASGGTCPFYAFGE